MIYTKSGNMFDVDADVLVNTINCVGVMGCGVALEFKKRYPNMFREYCRACKSNEILPGTLWYFRASDHKLIVNFPTKDHWRERSRYSYISSGLKQLKLLVMKLSKGSSIAVPALGCGHGGLDWNVVLPLINEHLEDSEHVDIYVFQPIVMQKSRPWTSVSIDKWRK